MSLLKKKKGGNSSMVRAAEIRATQVLRQGLRKKKKTPLDCEAPKGPGIKIRRGALEKKKANPKESRPSGRTKNQGSRNKKKKKNSAKRPKGESKTEKRIRTQPGISEPKKVSGPKTLCIKLRKKNG